ncbi:translocation/assembly module TamB domain-containing protein, partial [Craterilacuibacter sp.]|uniref:translocation/assembly module TamB domain-containing protein n=1 Tax=Craterilacuibacter sp. TaxID=2870909 RepID=UPI003F3DBC09
GTLWRGFTLQGVVWTQPLQRITLSSVALAWQPQALWQRRLQITRLQLGSVLVDDRSPASGKPLLAPVSLALPLAIEAEQVSLQSLTLQQQALVFSNMAGSYRYLDGQHALALESLHSPWGHGAGSLALAAQTPFALSGRVELGGELDGRKLTAYANLGGSLLAPTLALKGQATGIVANVDGQFAPFAPVIYQKIKTLSVRLGGINPAVLFPGAPAGMMALALEAQPAGDSAISGGLSLTNTNAGPITSKRFPLTLAVASFAVNQEQLTLSDAFALLADGRVDISGIFTPRDFDLKLALQRLSLPAIAAGAPAQTVSGTAVLAGEKMQPLLSLQLSADKLRLASELVWRRGKAAALDIRRLQLTSGNGVMDVNGLLGLDGARRLALAGTFQAFNPAVLDARLPSGSINAKLKLDASLADAPQGTLSLMLTPSQLSGAPLSGRAAALWQADRLARLDALLLLGGNRLEAKGAYGKAGDKLQLALQADNLGLLGPAFSGRAQAALVLAGTPAQPLFSGKLDASGLRLPGDISIAALNAEGELATSGNSPFALNASVRELRAGTLLLEQLALNGKGVRSRHTLAWDGKLALGGKPFALSGQLDGGLSDRSVWQGMLARLAVQGEPALQLLQPVSLLASADKVELGAGRWRVLDADWALQKTAWSRSGGVETAGRVQGVRLSALSPWLSLPLKESLSLGGDWALRVVDGVPQGQVNLQRETGDIEVPVKAGSRALGLSEARLNAQLDAAGVNWRVQLASSLASLTGQGRIQTLGGQYAAGSPLNASLRATLPSLAVFQPWLSLGQTLDGRAAIDLAMGGTLGAPQFSGPLTASALAFSDRRNGIVLKDGELSARFAGRELWLESLTFNKNDALTASGKLALVEGKPEAHLVFRLDKFRAISRPGRRVVASGLVNLDLDASGVALNGAIKIDRARVEMPKLGAPALGKDVVVVGRIKPDEAAASLPFAMAIELDLGDNFRFSGAGLTTGLAGQLQLKANPGEALAIYGQVNTVDGRFKAYGQDLDISKGVISFSGAMDNPGLSIRALRRLSPVGAGVEVSGSVLYPKVLLVADEPMSEKEKLAWLILGRSAGGGAQDDNALAAAAGGFLAGAVNDKLGLFDDIGLSSRGEKTLANGTVNPAEQVVTLGRQLSQSLYLGYEYGITSASQAVKVVYQLSKGWSAQLKAGTSAEVESRYTVRFD